MASTGAQKSSRPLKMKRSSGNQRTAINASVCLLIGLMECAQFAKTEASTSAYCDSSRLVRCQQDALKDMQLVALDAASVQYPISQGPPYSPVAKLREQQQRVTTPAVCRLVRSHLDCVLLTTPVCYENGLHAAGQSGDIALRAKRFLEQNNCNHPDASWQVSSCYHAPEIRNCEERYGFTVFGSMLVNSTSCLAYQAFKYCVETRLRYCSVQEMDMANEYLIDRAGDLAWRCPVNSTASAGLHSGPTHNPYALNNPSSAILSPSSYGSGYEQRPIATYGSSNNNLNLFSGTVRDQPWERFRTPYEDTRYGISRLPGLGGSGEVFDRLVAGGVGSTGFDSDSSDCPIKASPYARECEDTLIEQQRMARDSRDGIELQRRICCSLYQFRDCISRVVLDRCADSSPTAVEILMGVRRREMSLTCRGYSRDLCSGALAKALANPLLLLVACLIGSCLALRHQKQRL